SVALADATGWSGGAQGPGVVSPSDQHAVASGAWAEAVDPARRNASSHAPWAGARPWLNSVPGSETAAPGAASARGWGWPAVAWPVSASQRCLVRHTALAWT